MCKLLYVFLLSFLVFSTSINAQKKCTKLSETVLNSDDTNYESFKNTYGKKLKKYSKCLNKGVESAKKLEGPLLHLLSFATMVFETDESKKSLKSLNKVRNFKMPEGNSIDSEITQIFNHLNIPSINNFLSKPANIDNLALDVASLFPANFRTDIIVGFDEAFKGNDKGKAGLKVLFGLCGGNCTYEETFASLIAFVKNSGLLDEINLNGRDSFDLEKLQDSIGL